MAKVRLSGAQATMLATLYGRAVDARSSRSVLHDTAALDAVERLEFDFATTGMRRGDEVSVALRAGHLDAWTREYLAAHPQATVLHLACGLDSRVRRVDPGPGVRWYDVDLPDVIDLRRQVFPEPPGGRYELIASSVTDPAWLADVPADLPVLVVAEGLTMYLKPDEGAALLRRIVDHFPSGQFVFDAFSRRGIKLQKLNGPVQAAGATLYWGVDDPAELEAVYLGRLRCVTEMSAFDLDGYDRVPARLRVVAAIGRWVPLMRDMSLFYRLEF
ncbi:methyltransferase [Spongiactinospora gelatinilytica]|uniref:Methyltransferase n=1 Tax=Spongiactinospora gelatinilytica TaxID=2666298 RepID=A0A2W2G021_9ACTN|nr:class I SAM-dependent methyltransferase [Spongiactinospora gelatinilytica]PZG27467.1 methyltransferase [Spongiactinospora gelatinilytica]